MIRYIIRRLIGVVIMLGVISVATFVLFFAVPVSPAALSCGKSCSPAIIKQVSHKLGLDMPIPVQYGKFMAGIFVGRDFGEGSAITHCPAPCLGISYHDPTDTPVTNLIKEDFPVTFSITIGGAILWLLIGVGVGVLSGLRKGSIFDRAAMVVALAGVSLPSFFTGLLVITFVVAKWKILPLPAYVNFADNPLSWAQNLILPWITVAFLYAALYARLTRANMLETMSEDYIRTARAKGLSEAVVIRKHGLRAALTPIVTIAGLDIGGLLGGAILLETVYNFNGIGRLAVNAVNTLNLPVIVGTVLVAAFFIVMANLIVDVLYAFVDPKVRLS
ncbi:MAG: ABC transporter permease [Pseudonocardiales bacterium]|nr:MAG: ABC transporter permease [Pseudonocardiales bacterium]